MTSKVLVKLPVVPFSQRKKTPPDIISVPSKTEETSNDEAKFQLSDVDKIAQLEQNMKFLQDQHQITLVALHQEVEILRQKNKDLQFQLVFSKESFLNTNSPSSEESDSGYNMKQKVSPDNVNVAPLQVELLEKDIQDLKISLNESEERNKQMNQIIEEQKILIEKFQRSQSEFQFLDTAVQVDDEIDSSYADIEKRLEDSEVLVKKLQKENEEQRRDIVTLKSNNSYSNGNGSRSNSGRSRGGAHNNYHNRSSPHEVNKEENFHKFPPLQNYWHRGARANQSYDNGHNSQTDYHRNSRHHQDRIEYNPDIDNMVLPQVRNGGVRVDNSTHFPPFYRSRGHYSGGVYFKDGSNKKYRGQKPQRDRRDQDNTREYHQNYRDKESNDQRQKDYSGSSKNNREFKYTQRQ